MRIRNNKIVCIECISHMNRKIQRNVYNLQTLITADKIKNWSITEESKNLIPQLDKICENIKDISEEIKLQDRKIKIVKLNKKL